MHASLLRFDLSHVVHIFTRRAAPNAYLLPLPVLLQVIVKPTTEATCPRRGMHEWKVFVLDTSLELGLVPKTVPQPGLASLLERPAVPRT